MPNVDASQILKPCSPKKGGPTLATTPKPQRKPGPAHVPCKRRSQEEPHRLHHRERIPCTGSESFEVINKGNFPTHRPIRIRVATAQLKTVTNQLRRPTNYATLFQEKVEKERKAKQETMDAEAKAKNEEAKKVDENEIRKINLDKLHALMDKHLNEREHRIKKAVAQRNTTMQWDLIAAAVEAANIEFHGLTGKEAAKMRGRSKITFQKKHNDILQHR